MQTSYHELKENSPKRLWLEGGKLADAGFGKDTFYQKELDIDNRILRVVALPNTPENVARHKRREIQKVSGRKMAGGVVKPIMDIMNADVAKLLEGTSRYCAKVRYGEIVFSIAPEEVRRIERVKRFLKAIKRNSLDVATAFAGGGISSSAISEGIESAGIKTNHKWLAEMEGKYLDVALANNRERYKDTHLFIGRVQEIETSLVEPVDVFNFSMPCTNQSKVGKAKKNISTAEEAPESTALFGLINLIRASNPAVITSENVTQARNSATYQLLRHELTRLGYTISENDLDQSQGGSLEKRKRYWFVATSKGLPKIDIANMPVTSEDNKPFKSVADILDPEEATEGMWKSIDKLQAREDKNKKAGRGFSLNKLTPASKEIGTFVRNYAKHQVSNPHLFRNDDKEYRLLNKNEHARAQLIPTRLVNYASESIAHQILGQSINYMHGVFIGRFIGRVASLLRMHVSHYSLQMAA